MHRNDKRSYDWAKRIDTKQLRVCPLCGADAIQVYISRKEYYEDSAIKYLGRITKGIKNANLYRVKCISFWCGNIMTDYNESPKIVRAFWNILEGPGRGNHNANNPG